ncbi:MAG TPA: transcriptional regulator MraZ [Thiotrichales bacterium]|nr:transcriptional regulator MraZ [Thiotrichales bacterium]
MFVGANSLALDSKGRIAIPARYREELAVLCQGHLVVTIDTDPCLLIYPAPTWQKIAEALLRVSTPNAMAKRLRRQLAGNATEVEMDGQGRILVAPRLRKLAGLEKRVMLVGQLNKFELWDEDRWEDQNESWRDEEGPIDTESMPEELRNLQL